MELSKKMHAEGLTTEAIEEAQKAVRELLAEHPDVAEQAVGYLFNKEALEKRREQIKKDVAEGMPAVSLYPIGTAMGTKAKGEEVGESLD